MPREEVTGRFVGGLPFEIDLLETDLDSFYPKLMKGERIYWGMIVGALSGAWNESVAVRGIDWNARFATPGELKVLIPRGKRKRVSWRGVKQHCVLVEVDTGETSLNAARDIGRPAARAILGLLRSRVPVILPGEVFWEGAFTPTTGGKTKLITTGSGAELKEPVTAKRLNRLSLRMAKVAATKMPQHLVKALQWLTLARSADVRSEMFMHLWLAAITLASHGQPKRARDLTRLKKYTQQMITGVGSVTSPTVVDQLYGRLEAAYDIRNDLVHRADDSRITNELLDQLETDDHTLVDFELSKLGMSISA